MEWLMLLGVYGEVCVLHDQIDTDSMLLYFRFSTLKRWSDFSVFICSQPASEVDSSSIKSVNIRNRISLGFHQVFTSFFCWKDRVNQGKYALLIPFVMVNSACDYSFVIFVNNLWTTPFLLQGMLTHWQPPKSAYLSAFWGSKNRKSAPRAGDTLTKFATWR